MGSEIDNEKMEPDSDPNPFRNRFLGSGIGIRTVYGTGPDPSLNREWYEK